MFHTKGVNFLRSIIVSAFLILGLSSTAFALDSVYTGFFSKVAVSGYDPVAYFTESKPVKGNKKFKTEWNKAEWHFSSQENLDLFKANPEKYAPQYGGYCAWAVSQNDTASTDPKYWKIVDDKLYLNYSEDVQKKWEQNIPGFITDANQNWPALCSNCAN